jgi:hypothetical protein
MYQIDTYYKGVLKKTRKVVHLHSMMVLDGKMLLTIAEDYTWVSEDDVKHVSKSTKEEYMRHGMKPKRR